MRKLTALAFATAAALSAATASAQQRFGNEGQIVLGGDLRFAVDRSSWSGRGRTSFELQPAADFFVAKNLSLGGALGFGWAGMDGDAAPKETWLRVAPRIGYNVHLGDSVSLWPRFNLAFEAKWVDPGDRNRNAFGLGFDFPFAIHLARHFFVGIGPYVQTELAASADRYDDSTVTSFGFRTGVWGWF